MSVHTPAAPDAGTEPAGRNTYREPSLPIRMLAEAAGTFILVFVGVGALLYSGMLREADPLINALAFGVAFAAAVGLFARVSGGHANPAISLGAAVKGHLRWADLPAYWLGQLLGALAAGAVLYVTIPAGMSAQLQTTDQAMFGQTANTFGDLSYLAQVTGGQMSFSVGAVLALEALAAAVLTAVVLVTGARSRALAGPVLAGLTLTGLVLLLEPVSGGSVNPARSTASAIFAEPAVLAQLWLFWLAPLIGGAVAGLAYLLFSPGTGAQPDAEEEVDDEADPWEEDGADDPWDQAEDPWELAEDRPDAADRDATADEDLGDTADSMDPADPAAMPAAADADEAAEEAAAEVGDPDLEDPDLLADEPEEDSTRGEDPWAQEDRDRP